MKKARLLLITIAMMLVMTITAYAAFSAKISFSDPNTSVGETFTVRMKIKAADGKLDKASGNVKYDTSCLEFVGGDFAEGGAGVIKITGDSSLGEDEWAYTLKFKALTPGTTNITLDADSWEIYDASQNAAAIDHMGSSAVTIAGDGSGAINANLASLKISPGVLEPAFSPEITEYTALVGGDCSKITVSAPTADSNSKVIISGNSDLQLGENVVTCQVTAEDGTSTKTYTITVTKQEGTVDYGDAASGALQANVNGSDYEVAEIFDETMLPEGFIAEQIPYKGQTVQAGVNQTTGLTLMYLIGSDGSGDFYVYDSAADDWSPFATINTTEKSVVIVPLGSDVQVPDGFAETTLELNGKKVHGWIWNTDLEQEYCMVYGMNADGDKSFYRYDMKEKTIQRFFSNPVSNDSVSDDEYIETATKYNELIKDYNLRGYILIGLGIIAAILLIALIIVLITSRGNGGDDTPQAPRRKQRRDTEDDEERLAEARARRAQEREERRIRHAREAQPRDAAEERYMRGVESSEDDYTKVIPQKEIRQQAQQHQSKQIDEAQLQQALAKAVQKTTEPEHRTASDALDDAFETFEL